MIVSRRLQNASAFVVALALVTMIQPPSPANAANCTSADLQPTLGEFMVTQGVGGTSGYGALTRGKETLVKLFLRMPSSCAVLNGQYVKITNASLTVTIGTTSLTGNTLITSFASTPPLPPTVQSNSVADPVFVVPSTNLAPASTTGNFVPTFTATITYNRSDGATVQTGLAKTFTQTKTVERLTNALRIYIVPMGDTSQPFNTQYTATDQTIVQNAMQTLSRIYPTPAGVFDLSSVASGGVRYVVDTATMLDLKTITGAYVGSPAKFCGTSVNFTAIKGLLAQYLLTHNNANKRNPDAIADRVVGVVGGNGSSGPISWGTGDSVAGCADGMASVSSAESWIRLVDDQSGKPSRSGALAGMEIAHTFGLDPTPSFHSSSIQADSPSGTPAPGTDRAYNVSSRARIQYDHSVMNYNNTDSPWDNTTALLEPNDFAYLLCKLAPGSLTDTTCSPGKIGSSTGVLAGEKYIIAGTTDGTTTNTKVVEPYYELDTFPTEEQTDSALRLVQLDTSTATPTVVANFGVPWSPAVTDHDSVGDVTPITSGLRTFYAAASGFTGVGAGEVRLVKVADQPGPGNKDVDPLNSPAITLFSSRQIDPPTITSITGAAIPPSGGKSTLFRTQITPRIPPKPDVVFLADTTGSMGPALDNVKANAVDIMNDVLNAQPGAQFAAASYKDEPQYCGSDPYVFRIEQQLTSDPTALKNAITPNPDVANSGWQTAPGQGCDQPEAQLNALYQLGGGAVGFRTGSSRVIAWFGDAPGQDPSLDHTKADATAALRNAGIRVVAVNMTNSGEGTSLNTWSGCPALCGQATDIAKATGGVVKNTTEASQVSDAILAGLRDLDATVTPGYNGYNPDASSDQCITGGVAGPLSVRFAPVDATVQGGTSVDFTETVKVAAAAADTYTCRVYFKINGKVVQKLEGETFVDDPAYFQDISIVVADQQQTTLTVRATSPDPNRLLLDLIYQCNLFNFVAAVAIAPSSKTATEATFTANADTTNACAKSGGGGALVPYVSDGWNRVGGTVQTDTSSTPKAPTAAIYNPVVGAAINWDGTLSLRGSGEVAGFELPGTALTWSIRAPNGTTTVLSTHGNSVDVRAPMPNGWTQGTWTAILSVDFEGRTATAERTFGVYYQFIGFLNPVDNPPLINKGNTGKSFALKWQLKSGGAMVSSLSTVTSTGYALVTTCSATTAGGFTETSGQSVLRFDQTNMQFVFNWQTPSKPGLYLFRLTLSDGSTHDACVNLSK